MKWVYSWVKWAYWGPASGHPGGLPLEEETCDYIFTDSVNALSTQFPLENGRARWQSLSMFLTGAQWMNPNCNMQSCYFSDLSFFRPHFADSDEKHGVFGRGGFVKGLILGTLRDHHWIFLFSADQFSSVQSISHVQLFVTTWTEAHPASLYINNSWSLLMSSESVMLSKHLILCHPLLLLHSIFPSSRVFSDESVFHIRWAKYWRFSFSISPSNKYSRLISYRIDWFDLLAVQEPLKSFLQHHSSKASIFQCSAFFMLQLSHLYMTTGKTIALTIQTFASKVMSLLFNMQSRFVITFLLKSKHLLISWL